MGTREDRRKANSLEYRKGFRGGMKDADTVAAHGLYVSGSQSFVRGYRAGLKQAGKKAARKASKKKNG